MKNQICIPKKNKCARTISTHQRDQHGRFVVQLTLKNEISLLGRSQEIAERRLRVEIERKLQKDNELKKIYTDFIREYEALGHMNEVEASENEEKTVIYLPHHVVIKLTSTMTKVCVVFDASCETSSGKSLNDILAVGPIFQNMLFNILLRFRQHTYIVTGDINKIYRQILLHEGQRDLQRILWRKNFGEIQAFRLNTITYGLASASCYTMPTSTRFRKQNYIPKCKHGDSTGFLR